MARRGELSATRFWQLAGALALGQALVVAIAVNHGWFYNDDFALLMNASHSSLDWNYLKTPINDHLLPGLRLEFWLLRHSAALNYPLTIAVRVLLQAASTVLLLRLLSTLAGPRRRVLVACALYALCPLVLTNTLWLTVALSLLPAQVFVLAALNAHIRYTVSRNLRWAAVSGLCLLAGALFWEKVAVSAVLLPILSLTYLHEGSLGQRIMATLGRWVGWLVTAAPIAAFTGYFIAAGYGGATKPVTAGDLAGVLWMQWSRVLAPSLLGGPWSWFEDPHVSLGYAETTRIALFGTELAVVLVAVAGVRLVGWKSLIAWSLPAAPLVVGTSLVAFGRYAFFGQLIATTLRYGADLAVPFFLGVTMAVTPTSAADIRRRVLGAEVVSDPSPTTAADTAADTESETATSARAVRSRVRPPGRVRHAAVLATAAAAVLWLVGSLTSLARFDRHWGANPSRAYVSALTSNIAGAGPSLNLYDSTVSPSVLPFFFGPRWHLSDFLPLTGKRPTLDAAGTEPLLVDDKGELVPAVLIPAVSLEPPKGGLCAYLVQGAGTFRIALPKVAPVGDGFLRIDYLQQRPSTAEVSVVDAHGVIRAPVPSDTVLFGYELSHVTLRLPLTSVAAVIIRTGAPETHLCLGRITVGAPFPTGGAK